MVLTAIYMLRGSQVTAKRIIEIGLVEPELLSRQIFHVKLYSFLIYLVSIWHVQQDDFTLAVTHLSYSRHMHTLSTLSSKLEYVTAAHTSMVCFFCLTIRWLRPIFLGVILLCLHRNAQPKKTQKAPYHRPWTSSIGNPDPKNQI